MDLVWSWASKGIGLCLQHGQRLGCYEQSCRQVEGLEREIVSPCLGSSVETMGVRCMCVGARFSSPRATETLT